MERRASTLRSHLDREPEGEEIKHFQATIQKEFERRRALLRVWLKREPASEEIKFRFKKLEEKHNATHSQGFGGEDTIDSGMKKRKRQKASPEYEKIVIGSDTSEEDDHDDENDVEIEEDELDETAEQQVTLSASSSLIHRGLKIKANPRAGRSGRRIQYTKLLRMTCIIRTTMGMVAFMTIRTPRFLNNGTDWLTVTLGPMIRSLTTVVAGA